MPRRPSLHPRSLSCLLSIISVALGLNTPPAFAQTTPPPDWLDRWETNITGAMERRYCDTESGEELGWLVSPFLTGFYHGHRATEDPVWIDRLIDWTDAVLRRGVVEPDGHIGWPKGDGGGRAAGEYEADSLLGEAMLLRPVVMMADHILDNAELEERHGDKAREYLAFAERTFEKWDSRESWREVPEGGVWVVPAFGIDRQTGEWSDGYAERRTTGFTNPANKQNHIAQWLLALHDATGKTIYRERAEKWFRVMKSRMRSRSDGRFLVWNYWDPAGPWDYHPDGRSKHWVGVHPNGGYYAIDVSGIVAAFERELVFKQDDIDRLIATNRDFMWNGRVEDAAFQRIDGEPADPRWKNSPGVLWSALVPHDERLREVFVANHDPTGWGGLATTPWYLATFPPETRSPTSESTSR